MVRVRRPYILVKDGKSMFTEDHLEDMNNGLKSFDDLMAEGVIELIDVNEENDCLIALRGNDIKK